MSGSGSLEALVEQLLARVAELETALAQRDERVAELERQLACDSSNSSRPPSSDAPWSKQPAKKRSSRTRSGRKPGNISKVCPCCGTVTTPDWDDVAVPVEHRPIVAAPGSPVRIGPEALARAALLTCGHYLPVGRSRQLLEALTGIDVSTGLLAGVRGRVARTLEKTFLPRARALLAGAPVLHADETTGRAAGALTYVHVACTEYLTLLHVGGRGSEDIDAGGVLPGFTGVLVRDGYAGYEHLTGALHAWCGAHLLRDLRSISDADPDGQLWALAMANTLLEAHHAARVARAAGADVLDAVTLSGIRNYYHRCWPNRRSTGSSPPPSS